MTLVINKFFQLFIRTEAIQKRIRYPKTLDTHYFTFTLIVTQIYQFKYAINIIITSILTKINTIVIIQKEQHFV